MTPAEKDPGDAPPVEPCGMFVVDGDGTRKCGEPATETRQIGRLTFAVCQRCAGAIDACPGGGAP